MREEGAQVQPRSLLAYFIVLPVMLVSMLKYVGVLFITLSPVVLLFFSFQPCVLAAFKDRFAEF